MLGVVEVDFAAVTIEPVPLAAVAVPEPETLASAVPLLDATAVELAVDGTLFEVFVGAVCVGETDDWDKFSIFATGRVEAGVPTEGVVWGVTAFEPTVFEEFASEPCVISVEIRVEPFAEAGASVFAKLTAAFVGKAGLEEEVRNSEPSLARKVLSAVNSENAKRAHRMYFMRKQWREECILSVFFITILPPLRCR